MINTLRPSSSGARNLILSLLATLPTIVGSGCANTMQRISLGCEPLSTGGALCRSTFSDGESASGNDPERAERADVLRRGVRCLLEGQYGEGVHEVKAGEGLRSFTFEYPMLSQPKNLIPVFAVVDQHLAEMADDGIPSADLHLSHDGGGVRDEGLDGEMEGSWQKASFDSSGSFNSSPGLLERQRANEAMTRWVRDGLLPNCNEEE